MTADLRTLVTDAPTGYWTLCAHVPGRGVEVVSWWAARVHADQPPIPRECVLRPELTGHERDEIALVYAEHSQSAWRAYRADYAARHPRRAKVAV